MEKREGGFTLIEAIVATAVFALLLSALYQGLATGWRGLKSAKAEDAAIALLSQRLASSGVETPLQSSTMSGRTLEGLSWQSDITPYAGNASTGNSSGGDYQGYWVTVIVRWNNGRFSREHSLQATTLKLKKSS